MAQLVPIPAGSSAPIQVPRPVILVGRHPECDVRIDSSQISRRHCCLALAYDRLIIRDLGSLNGVRVNGQLVDEIQLSHGDEVAIAHLIYRVDAPKATPPPPPAAPPTRPPSKPPSDLPPSLIDFDDEFIPLSD